MIDDDGVIRSKADAERVGYVCSVLAYRLAVDPRVETIYQRWAAGADPHAMDLRAQVWAHTIGRPPEQVQLSADLAITERVKRERELFGWLSVEQMQELATESQRLVDKAMAMARVNSVPPIPATVGRPPEATTGTPGPKETGDDVTREDRGGPLDSACAQVIAPPASGRPSPAAAVHNVATRESDEPPTGSAEGGGE